MPSFRAKDWILGALRKTKAAFSKVRQQQLPSATTRVAGGTAQLLKRYRKHIALGVGATAVVVTGVLITTHYIEANTFEIYHVSVDGKDAGVVSNPKVIEQRLIEKTKEIEAKYPNVQMVLNTDKVTYKSEKAYKAKSDDQAALKRLDSLITAQAVGVELKIDGKVVAVVKDQETADAILEKYKGKYLPQKQSRVGILSAASGKPQQNKTEVKSVSFLEKVETASADIEPNEVLAPEQVLKMLEKGDTKPTKYTVQEGDCVSCIADKFDISKQVIYKNNSWIENDMIKVGETLDLTVLQPALNVKTVEQVTESEEIQYDTIYEKDPNLPAGKTKIIQPGKLGLKKVMYKLVKQNGLLMEEELLDEQVIQKPQSARAKRGTKIMGEGSGKFAWPVIGARLSSSYGQRWGRLHKGIDLISSNRTILAADEGKVIFAGKKEGYGNCIIIDHKNGYETLYGHLSKIGVSKGDVVQKGTKIGVMGNTGHSFGTHLHFEIHKNDGLQNPMKFLSRKS